MRFRSLLMVAAGVAGSVSSAAAQTPPEPAPTPSPAAPPPAQSDAPAAAEAPATLPPAPVPVTPTSGADTATPPEDKPKPLFFRNSYFTWSQSATTQIFGVGRDYIGTEDQYYGWDFTLRPWIYVVDQPKDQVILTGDLGWNVELTNSNTSLEKREAFFKDISLGGIYSHKLWSDGGKEADENSTTGSFSLRATLPTSQMSRNQGKYLTVGLGPSVRQQVKLLGSKADGLNDLTIIAGVAYSHLFSRATTPTNPDLRYPRQGASGESILSDQLRGSSFTTDGLTLSALFILPLYKDLALWTSTRLIGGWHRDFQPGAGSGCDVRIDTGCVQAVRAPDRALYTVNTSFDLLFRYPVVEVVTLGLGYHNDTNQLGENGQRRNFFYSPDAQFYLDVSANLDVIYSKITRRDQKKATASSAPSPREL